MFVFEDLYKLLRTFQSTPDLMIIFLFTGTTSKMLKIMEKRIYRRQTDKSEFVSNTLVQVGVNLYSHSDPDGGDFFMRIGPKEGKW